MASKNCRCLAGFQKTAQMQQVYTPYLLNVPGSQDRVVFLTINPSVLVLVSRFAAFAGSTAFPGLVHVDTSTEYGVRP